MGDLRVRWALALGIGVLVQMAVVAVAALTGGFVGESARLVAILVAPLVLMSSGGYWVAREARSRFLLHGLLVGLGGLLFYGVLAWTAQTAQGPTQVAAHVMKILGGLAGGGLAAWQSGRSRQGVT